jgi:UDP-N-acetylglucosamine acyltransferase
MAEIHPTAVIEKGAKIADDVVIGPFCWVGPQAVIGARTRLMSHVVIHNDTTIGEDNVVWPHCVFGGDPQDVGYAGQPTRLVIGNGNTFRENVTIHRGSHKGGELTTVGDRNYMMIGVHIAHDCHIGNHVLMANNIMLAGHIHVQDHVVMAGAVAIHHFATIGSYAFIGGLAGVVHDVPPYMIVDGHPARVRAVNRVGLKRNGFTDDQIGTIDAAYRQLYRHTVNGEQRPVPMADRLVAVENDFGSDANVANLISFVRKAMSGPHGRYLEQFR